MDLGAMSHVRDTGRDVILAQDALNDALETLRDIEDIDDMDAAHAVLKIAADTRDAATQVHDLLTMKIELAS